MRGLEARLQRLEQAATRRTFREDPEFNADLACLGSLEFRRGCDALRAGIDGDEARAAEATNLLVHAHVATAGGLDASGYSRASASKSRDKKGRCGEFTGALGRRHNLLP